MPASTRVRIRALAPLDIGGLLRIFIGKCGQVSEAATCIDGTCRSTRRENAAGQEGALQRTFATGTAAAKARRLAHAVQARHRLACGIDHAALQILSLIHISEPT